MAFGDFRTIRSGLRSCTRSGPSRGADSRLLGSLKPHDPRGRTKCNLSRGKIRNGFRSSHTLGSIDGVKSVDELARVLENLRQEFLRATTILRNCLVFCEGNDRFLLRK